MNIVNIILSIILLKYIKNSKNRLLSESILSEEKCDEIKNNCIKCNSPLNSCLYNNGICSDYVEETNSSNYSHYSKLMECNDELTIEKMNDYCGKIVIDKSLNQVIIKNSILNGNYSIEDLYCSWEINQSKDIENVKIQFKKIYKNIKLGILIYDSNNNTFYEINKDFSIKLSKNNFNKTQIIYYHSNIPKVYPFDMTYKIKVGIKLSEIFIICLTSIGIIFIIISIITLINFIKKNPINEQLEDDNKNEFNIEKIKPIKYTNALNVYNQICPTCLEEFKIGTNIILLNCFHSFHLDCINLWINKDLKNNKHCPICNLNIMKKFDERNNDSDRYISNPSFKIEINSPNL